MRPSAGQGQGAAQGCQQGRLASKAGRGVTPPTPSSEWSVACRCRSSSRLLCASLRPGSGPPVSPPATASCRTLEAAGRHSRLLPASRDVGNLGLTGRRGQAQPPPSPCHRRCGEGGGQGQMQGASPRTQPPPTAALAGEPGGRKPSARSAPGDTPGIRDHGEFGQRIGQNSRAAVPVALRLR